MDPLTNGEEREEKLEAEEEEEVEEDVFMSHLPPGTEDDEGGFMEGFLEKYVTTRWTRYWCSLKDGCLCFYVTPNDQITADSTDLDGYLIEQLVDRYQGKRFVISLTHTDYVPILLSVDSRDELEIWHQALADILALKARRKQPGTSVLNTADTAMRETMNSDRGRASPSVEIVKHKLLAEMLRQKTELQKIRAARNGTKAGQHPDTPIENTDGSLASPKSANVASLDERVRVLTRLRQRRMSTQIKMSAIQKQLDESTGTTKEKKTVFQLRKKPDVIQSHTSDNTRQSDLEEQVKRLSSRLVEIESSISTHEGATSPRKESSKSTLRHSCDSSLFRLDAVHASLDFADVKTAEEDVTYDGKKKEKSKEKSSEIVRSSTFKSNMQKLAHRTFARAHWSKLKKQGSKSNVINNNDMKLINANDSSSNSRNTSPVTEKPPDVIDVTGSNRFKGGDSADASIVAPPDSFRTDDTIPSSTDDTVISPRKHRTAKERILSKITTSHSFTQADRVSRQMKPSSSSPSLFKLLPRDDSKKEHDQHNVRTKSPLTTPSSTFVPRLNLNSDPEENTSSDSSNRPPSSETGYESYNPGYFETAPKVSSARGIVENRLHLNRSVGACSERPRSGFYSARVERVTTNPNRNSWSYGALSPGRREVNPNALAEIKAFEELSSKFLGIQDNSCTG